MLGKLSYIITASTQPLKNKLGEAKTSMKSADQQMSKSGKAIAGSSKKMSASAGNALQPMEQGLSSINPAAGQAVQGMKSMSMGAKALNAALGPIGLIIGAIGLAVAALTSYFKGSVEGQQKMANIMAYLGGIADTVKDLFIDLGKWIVWAFENPQEAVKKLWEMIKTNLINRFTGMVDMIVSGWKVIAQGAKGVGLAIKGIFDKEAREASKEAFAEMGEGMKEFGEAAIQAATGVEDLIGKVTGGAKKLSKAAKKRAEENMALQERENKLEMQQIDNKTKIARIDAGIAKARMIANDEQVSATEAITAQEKAMELVNQKMAIKEQMAREELAIQRERMALGHDGIEDLEKEAQLAADLIGLEQARDSEMRNLLRRHGTLVNRKEAETAAEQKAIEETSAAKQAAIDKETAAREGILEEIRQAQLTEVEILQDALDKKLALHDWSEAERLKITQYYQDQIDAIKKTSAEKELESKQDVLEEIRKSDLTKVEALKESMKEELAAHEFNEEEKAKVTKYWEDQIAKAKAENLTEGLEAAMQGISIVRQFQDAAMQAELNQAGDNEAKKEEIRKRYAKKQKRMAIGEAVIGTAVAVVNALKALPNPMAIVMAGIAAASGAAQVATIAAQPMATGGVIPPGYPRDSYPALLTSGETVTPPGALPSGGGTLTTRISRGDLLIMLQQGKEEFEGNF